VRPFSKNAAKKLKVDVDEIHLVKDHPPDRALSCIEGEGAGYACVIVEKGEK